jgi:peptidoglycan/xylan/chitin deacetylase (PgdA/CDA1 family)
LAYLVKKIQKYYPKELYDFLKVVKPFSKECITFDDSTKGQYINAYPLLKKYGFTAVYFVPLQKSSITYAQLREMGKMDDIGSHSATHIDLVKEDETKLYSEIVESRYSLQSGQDKMSYSSPTQAVLQILRYILMSYRQDIFLEEAVANQ